MKTLRNKRETFLFISIANKEVIKSKFEEFITNGKLKITEIKEIKVGVDREKLVM